MKKLLTAGILLALVSCGQSSSSGDSKKNKKVVTESIIRESVNSEEGKRLIANNWCLDASGYRDDDNWYNSTGKYIFSNKGEVTYLEFENDTNNELTKDIGVWGIKDETLILENSYGKAEFEFKFEEEFLVYIDYNEITDDNGKLLRYENQKLYPCE